MDLTIIIIILLSLLLLSLLLWLPYYYYYYYYYYHWNISNILQFIVATYSVRFMAGSSSNFVNNISKVIAKILCKHWHEDKKCQTFKIKYKYCHYFVEYTNFKNDLIE